MWRLGACVLVLGGCATTGAFVWVDRVPESQVREQFGVHVGDMLRVRVLPQETLGGDVRVRADGRISLPFALDVKADGRSPDDVGAELQASLKGVLVDPRVTVVVLEAAPLKVAVMGLVNRPGMYTLEGGRGVLHALAQAGGPLEDASSDGVFVLRTVGKDTSRIRFSMESLTRGVGAAARFQLQTADVVMVE